MKVENSKNFKTPKPTFKGPLDGLITQSLVTIDTNPMVNAALVDVVSMVAPRTYVDTKERNKYAGAETLFRELTGTIIVCLSSGFLAKGISHAYNKYVTPGVKVNPNSWVSNDSLALLKHSWDKTQDSNKYVEQVLTNVSGLDGKNTSKFNDINWNNVEWYDDDKWANFTWVDKKFNNIQNKLKNKDEIVSALGEIIGKHVNAGDAKQILEIAEHRVGNALQVSGSVNVELDGNKLGTSLHNLLRDTYDLGKNVFTKGIDIEAAVAKLEKMNKVKTIGAISIASILGLTNQYINRQITKKRTGTDAFVGNVEYKKLQEEAKNHKTESKVGLWGLKLLASAGIVGLAAAVMKIKSPKQLIKELEFTSAITSGNAIKTVYTATLVGRFLAAKDETELRESATRDYLGFLNWLVFGGFVSKGVANLLDKDRTKLFNIKSGAPTGEGIKNTFAKIKYWLNEVSLKSHAEISAKGLKFAKDEKNIWKLNAAHVSGLAYSTIALGILLPKLNVAITKHKHKREKQLEQK